MFDETELKRALDMQQRSFLLLKWMADIVKQGIVSFNTAHQYTSLPDAAADWIEGHYLNIPDKARPPKDDLPVFCEMFSTYLHNSFNLTRDPGKQRVSSDGFCFCPMCSWLVDAPNLTAKKVESTHKKKAAKMRVQAMESLIAEQRLPFLSKQKIEDLLKDEDATVDACYVAYGYDLRSRMKGIANGPAVLALWRGFAWKQGTPIQKFRLHASAFIESEQRLLERLRRETDRG